MTALESYKSLVEICNTKPMKPSKIKPAACKYIAAQLKEQKSTGITKDDKVLAEGYKEYISRFYVPKSRTSVYAKIGKESININKLDYLDLMIISCTMFDKAHPRK